MRPHFKLISFFLLLSITLSYSQNKASLFDYDKNLYSAEIVKSGRLDSLASFEKVVLKGLDSKIPFYHIRNNRNSNKDYAILIHGLGGNKFYWIYPSMPYLQYTKNLTTIKDTLLELGYSLIIVDVKYHGERAHELNYRDISTLPPLQNIEDAEIFSEMMISSVKELRLIMDYVDNTYQEKGLKFNLVGYSLGGGLSLLLNTVENRIQGVVACVPPMRLPFSDIENSSWATKEIKDRMKALSPYYAATKQNSPVTLIMGEKDFFVPADDAKEFFKKLPEKDKKLIFHNSGHELPDEYIKDVIDGITQYNKK